jgi:O-antigen ligase
MIVAALNTEKKLRIFFYLYISLVSLIFVEPFIKSFFGMSFIWNNGMWRLAGATSYFGHPNQLGGITSANLPFFFYLMQYEKSKIGKILYLSLIIIGIRVVMLTQSRTGFLGVLMFGFFVWLFSKNKIISLVLGILLLFILWQFAPEQTKVRFSTFFSIEKVLTTDRSDFEDDDRSRLASMASRWTLIQRSWTCFLEHPIIGVGLRNFNSYNGRKYGLWHPPHNTYLQALAEMGLIGFLAFMYFNIISFKNLNTARKIQKNFPAEERFLYYLTKAVTVFLLVRLVVSTFGQDLYVEYWWLAAGFGMVIYRITLNKYQNLTEL